MVKPVPWTNSCVISIQSYLLCHTCDKQHRHTWTTVPFFHLSETLCNTPKHFHFKEYSSQTFSNKLFFKGKKKALSFGLKIHAAPENKTSELKSLIKEEMWELQRSLISKGLQLTENEESWTRNASKPLFYCQFLPSLLLRALSNVKSDWCYQLQNTLHYCVHFKKEKEAAAPDFHTGRDRPGRTSGCAPGSQLPNVYFCSSCSFQTGKCNQSLRSLLCASSGLQPRQISHFAGEIPRNTCCLVPVTQQPGGNAIWAWRGNGVAKEEV